MSADVSQTSEAITFAAVNDTDVVAAADAVAEGSADSASVGSVSVGDVSVGDETTSDAAVDSDEAPDAVGTQARVSASGSDTDLLVREGDVAADYLEQLLDIVDYDGDIDLDVENGRAVVAVVGTDLAPLVGPGGTTLDALQELTRLAVQQKTGVRSRLMLDISGHRSKRRSQLSELATATAQTVISTGTAVPLAPMNPFERKVVHDVIGGIAGVRSESDGDEPERRVVVHPER